MLHKTQKILSGGNFSDAPENIIPAVNGNININVSGNGLIKGTSGLRWWDSNLLTDNGIVAGVKDVPIQLPFLKGNLYSGMVDLICEVSIDGTKYIYAASNSPDNVVATVAPTNTNVYYLELHCAGLNNASGSSNTLNHFMQGGKQVQGGGAEIARIRFSEPTATAGTINISAEYVSYNNTTPAIAFFTKSIPFGVGVVQVNAISMGELAAYYFTDAGYFTYSTPGFYKIQATTSSSSYRSALQCYHWGQSN